jgi:hypothetical protein
MRWDWDSDIPGGLVADELGLGKTLTLVVVAIICKLLTWESCLRVTGGDLVREYTRRVAEYGVHIVILEKLDCI